MTKMPIQIELYSDVHCPYAYLTAYRLRQLGDEYRHKIAIVHRSLSLEYINNRSTPKQILDNETPIILLEEPGIPYQPWFRPASEWPVTMWPAFEAIKCAERQSFEQADDLDWAIRQAFFAESRCISMRHVLFELAKQVGLDMDRFTADFDGGLGKRAVLEEAQMGWETLKVEGSPTFVLPSGERVPYFALPKLHLDKQRNYRATLKQPAPCHGQKCLDLYREMFDKVLYQRGH